MWEASEIYAEAKPEIIPVLCSNLEFSDSIYMLSDLEDYGSNGKLLVVRGIGQYKEMPILWDSISSPEPLAKPIFIPAQFQFDVPVDQTPPIGFLEFLKWLSQSTNSWVSYYFHQTWGGMEENEFSFVFGEADKVYIREVEHSYDVIEYQATGEKAVVDGSVLQHVLRHYKLRLKTRYFEPHTGGFNWAKYELQCSDKA